MTHVQVEKWKKCVSYVPSIHTSDIQHTLATRHHLDYSGIEAKKQFTVNDSGTPVTLK